MKAGFDNDYAMHELGEKVASWICQTYSKKDLSRKQAELKMEWLIQRFKWDIYNGAKYFEKLRDLYSPTETEKIRKAYHN